MKKFYVSMFAMMMALVCVGFTSCGDDDKESSENTGGIVGEWKGNSGRDILSITFNNGGKGFLELSRYGDSYSSDPLSKSYNQEKNNKSITASFTYVKENEKEGIIYIPEENVNYITRGPATYHYAFRIEGKQMCVDGYDDYDSWILIKQ